jgi:hypothetical protein
MHPLFTEAELQRAKCRESLPLKCLSCGGTFHRPKNKILAQFTQTDYRADFCSQKCQAEHLKKVSHKEVSCESCFMVFNKAVAKIKSTKHNFCSRSCSAKFHNSRKDFGIRVSKMEVFLQERLPALYPKLHFQFNGKQQIGSELDIYIQQFELAFEVNGIFHYQPIYGEEKFLRTQENDKRKLLECKSAGISLHVIDISSISHFEERKALPFQERICFFIDEALSKS